MFSLVDGLIEITRITYISKGQIIVLAVRFKPCITLKLLTKFLANSIILWMPH